VNVTARSSNAAAAAMPRGVAARLAESINVPATSSSGRDRRMRAMPSSTVGIRLRIGSGGGAP